MILSLFLSLVAVISQGYSSVSIINFVLLTKGTEHCTHADRCAHSPVEVNTNPVQTEDQKEGINVSF